MPADRDVAGVVEMVLDATQNDGEPLTAERLFGWHAALFPTGRSGMHRIGAGAWHPGPMQGVSGPVGRGHVQFEASEVRVGTDMPRFLDWFNVSQEIDPVLKAAVAQLWFVAIHPFEAGNGRIARTIAERRP